MTEALPSANPTEQATISQAEDRVSVAPNWKLVWWRFRKNKLAVVSAVVLIVFYAVVFFPDFFAAVTSEAPGTVRSLASPNHSAYGSSPMQTTAISPVILLPSAL